MDFQEQGPAQVSVRDAVTLFAVEMVGTAIYSAHRARRFLIAGAPVGLAAIAWTLLARHIRN